MTFVPGGQDDLAPAGVAARVRANMEAVRLLARLDAEDRHATASEQEVLARWSGWGAAPALFNGTDPQFATERAELRQLIGDQGYAAASRTTLNAHYTDPDLDRAMWKLLTDLGFEGGLLLEPGCGAGTFIGTAPVPVQAVGVELDPTTARVAAELYPDAQIRSESFADTNLPIDAFDAAIGNVPFGDVRLHDSRFNQGNFPIHDHFIYKAVNQLRPGGVAAFLTSRYTMDKKDPGARRQISQMADLVTAVRLPTGAMRRSAGTDAVVDLLVLRRRAPGQEPASTDWESTRATEMDGPSEGERVTENVNDWFADHPELVMGTQHVQIGMYGRPGLEVDGPLGRLGERLTETVAPSVRAAGERGLTWTPADGSVEVRTAGRFASSQEDFQEGHIREHEGAFETLRGGMWQPLKVPQTQIGETRALLDMRDQVVALLAGEAATLDNTPELDAARVRLRGTWQDYVNAYGPLGRVKVSVSSRLDSEGEPITSRLLPAAVTRFRRDPYGPVVLALETMDEETGVAVPGPLLRERMVVPRQPVTGVESIGDAVAVSLDTKGRLDLDYMTDLLGAEGPAQVEAMMAADGAGFEVPGTGGGHEWVPREQYLSGAVRTKLATARDAAISDPDRWTRNVEALEQVIPADLTPSEIEARLGAVWIPASDYTAFLRSISGDRHARVLRAGDRWKVQCAGTDVQTREIWGTDRMPVGKLLSKLLAQEPLIVKDYIEGEPAQINPVDTEAAQAKGEELQARFAEWVWEDPERTDRLCEEYNRRFNDLVLRDYSTAGERLSLPGLQRGWTPRPHQRAAVARILDSGSVGLFHETGAGKTAEMVMGVTELKRLGLVHKPCVVVPNHMLEQMTREWLQLYPRARILSAGSKDSDAAHRRDLVARAATGDWDAIIMSRGAFEALSVTPEHQASYIGRQLDVLRQSLEEAKLSAEDKDDRAPTSIIKQIEKDIVRQEEAMKKLADTPHLPGLNFEDMGVDHLTVDELHDFKNLATPSKITDAKIKGSGRAQDLHMKVELLRQQYGRRVMIGATATPISNSIGELYNMTRYLAPELLEKAGLETFDQWAATFGEQVTETEVTVAGQLKPKSRFARFTNVPELAMMLHAFGDVKTEKDLHLPKPQLAVNSQGRREVEVVTVPASEELRKFQIRLGERADRMSGMDPRQDNMLKLSSEGRRAATDLRLVDPTIIPTGETKVSRAADLIAQTWAEHREDRFVDPDTGELSDTTGVLQMVFADLGTPGSDKPWTVYDALRDELVARGMPVESIRFVQDARKDTEKASLFAACRSGHVSVLIGSTEAMGTGVNVQQRLLQEIHVDAPWRPADVTQRDGRMMRQGNQNREVHLIRMVTEGSFDTYMWQTLQRKETFISQIMNADLSHRDMEDIGTGQADLFAQIKAVASGDPLLLRHAQAERELKKLRRLETAHQRGEQRLTWKVRNLGQDVEKDQALIGDLTPLVERSRDTAGELFRMTVGEATLTNRAAAAAALARRIQPHMRWVGENFGAVATLGGQTITARWNVSGMTLGLEGTERANIEVPEENLAELSKMGTVTRLENAIRRLPTRIQNARLDIAAKTAEMDQAKQLMGQPFKHAGELKSAQDTYALVTTLMTARQGSEPARDWISVVGRGEDDSGTPVFEGPIARAGSELADGVYRGTDENGVPVAVSVTESDVKVVSMTGHLEPHDQRSGATAGFSRAVAFGAPATQLSGPQSKDSASSQSPRPTHRGERPMVRDAHRTERQMGE